MNTHDFLRTELLQWFDDHRRILPWRTTRTPYSTWISETMLQQTRVTTVIPYFLRFMEDFPNIEKLAAAPLEVVYKNWEGLGYYSRARNLHKGAMYCMENHRGALPFTMEALLKVPGIGPYTAGAIASMAYNLPVPAVDGNVIRVFSRFFGLYITPQDTEGKKEIHRIISSLLPKERAGDFNEAIMDFGATVCIPGTPNCENCPLFSHCEALKLNLQNTLPLKKEKKPRPSFPLTILIFRKGEAIYVQKRPDTGLLSGLYEFISVPGKIKNSELSSFLFEVFSLSQEKKRHMQFLGESFHIFTHLRWEMAGYLIDIAEDENLPFSFFVDGEEKERNGSFVSPETAKKFAFPSALKTYVQAIFP